MSAPDFSRRSYQAEMLDAPDIPEASLRQNLQELDTINSLLGGHDISIEGIKKFNLVKGREYHIADIGSGGGDTLRALAKWGRKKDLSLKLTGVDMNSDAIKFAGNACKDFPEISFIHSDYRDEKIRRCSFDIVSSALFCHHLNDEQLEEFFRWAWQNSRMGFMMNDLQRHPLAYHSIKILTQIFSHSPLVKNDAPLSVLRGFRESELLHTCRLAEIQKVSILWKWAFRYLLIAKHDAQI